MAMDNEDMNTDGTSIGNPVNAGFGGINGDQHGNWITGYSGSCGYTTSLNAELLAIYFGMNLAWNLGYKTIVCESDSKVALDLIMKGINSTHPYAPLIQKIEALRRQA
ncbi:putative ribonuclease H protein [Glycine max]|nr:putative ribonuclease H protein [Glycine max]